MGPAADYIWDYRNPYKWMEKTRRGMPPLIISCAITGGVHGKEYNENLRRHRKSRRNKRMKHIRQAPVLFMSMQEIHKLGG